MALWSFFTTTYGLILLLEPVSAWLASSNSPPISRIHALKESPTITTTSTRLRMISDLFKKSSSNENKLPTLPRDVKSAVSSCRDAVQAALQQRISRMDIEFPVGTKFSVERVPSNKKKGSNVSSETPTLRDFQRSDRELARLFVDMFQPVGGQNIAVAFTDVTCADEAKTQWKDDSTVQCNILSMDRRKSRLQKAKKKTSAKGFAAKIAAEILEDDDDTAITSGPFKLPENTEVALFVAPGSRELIVVEKICQQVGMGTLVVLLNARLANNERFGTVDAEKLFMKEFEPVFSLTAAPQEVSPGCLLYRSYPGDWALARKPKVGPPISIFSSPQRPSRDECKTAYESIEVSDIEKGVDNVVDTIATWLK